MRDAQHEHQKSESVFGSALGHCLMDSDAESLRIARRNRRRSLLLSTGIQATLLTAAVVLPLFATNELVARRLIGDGPLITRVPPVPPPPGQQQSGSRGPSSPATTASPMPVPIQPFAPTGIPDRIASIDDRDSAPPAIGGGGPAGPGIPGSVGPFGLGGGPAWTPPPPPVDPKPRTVRVSASLQAAKLIHKVEPRYPILAVQTRREGNVELRAIIATDGTVQNLEVVSGHPLFIEATLQAVREWRYQPTLLSGEPVEVQTYITVIFRLNRN